MAEPGKKVEQFPIGTVKRIAIESTRDNVIESEGGNAEMPEEVRSPHESWREVAQLVVDEADPKRVFELAEQLLATLDRENFASTYRVSRTLENDSE